MNLFLKTGLIFSLAVLIISPIVHLLKIAHISYEVGAYLFYIGFPLITGMVLIGGLWNLRLKNPYANKNAMLLVSMFATAFMSTIYFSGDPIDIGGNALRIIFVIVFVSAYGNSQRDYLSFFDNHLTKISWLSLFAALTATVLMHLAGGAGLSVYFGLQTTVALISLAYGVVYRNTVFIGLSLIAIVGSGKRGVMLAAAAIFLLYGGVLFSRGKFARLIISLITIFFGLFILYYLNLIPEAIASRIEFLFTEDSIDVNRVTSGRAVEVEAALRALSDTPLAWLTGFGLGSTIIMDGVADSTVHFSPVALIMIFGAPITSIFYGALIYYGYLFFKDAKSGKFSNSQFVMLLIFAGELFFSFTAFTILQSYALWISYSYLLAQHFLRNNKRG